MPSKYVNTDNNLSKLELLRQKNSAASERKRFEVFKDQDLENGHFDVTFETEGKKLHAHKIILTAASETFDSWLSTRWSAKDEIIKIEGYSYDNFYQLLSYIYSGYCELTDENVYQITDIAEFYGIQCLKDFCDIYLSEMELNIESIEEMVEFSVKYSMKELQSSLCDFIFDNSTTVFAVDSFLTRGKPFIEFLSHHPEHECHEEFFETLYKCAEHRALQQKVAGGDETFNLHEAIVAELEGYLPYIKFSLMYFEFLMDFVIENGFFLSPTQLFEYFARNYEPDDEDYDEDYLLKEVYLLAEKQALKKQKMFPNDNFDLVASVRNDLAQIIPKINFPEVGEKFFKNFVVPKKILTEEQILHILDTRITISNDGNTITGGFKDDLHIHHRISMYSSRELNIKPLNNKKVRFLEFSFRIPKEPSTVQKMKGVDWYLCLESDGILTLKHHTLVGRDDYLITEMKSKDEFTLNPDEYCHLNAAYYNV